MRVFKKGYCYECQEWAQKRPSQDARNLPRWNIKSIKKDIGLCKPHKYMLERAYIRNITDL